MLTVLSIPLGPLPPLGDLLEPVGGFWTEAEVAVPLEYQRLTFAGLGSPVDVYRDAHAVPHVFAESDEDLFRAVGYLHASDRLFQMDLQRRVAFGRLAEVLGPSLVDTDVFLRELGLAWAAERSVEAMDEETFGVLEAYAEGVNARIGEASPHALPLEFKLLNTRPEAWTPLDSVAFAKYMGWTLSGTFEDLELALFTDAYGAEAADELFPVETPLPLPIIPEEGPAPSPARSAPLAAHVPAAARHLLSRYAALSPLVRSAPDVGSNNWVVHGSRTDDGAPLLANDPHLGLTQPAIWYQVRLKSPRYDVYGVSLLGAPPVVLGFNEDVAWGFTNVGADVVDFFEEQVNPDDEDQYLYQGQWRDFELREEVIGVKGARSVPLTIRISVHGPVLTSHGQTVAMQWTGHRATNELRGLLAMNRASTWEAFREALEDFQVPAQNVVYADADGNIGIVVNGLYPLRKQGLGRLPVDGSSGDSDWLGFVPMDEVPSARNPTQGFLVSANQVPTGDAYPHYLGWSWADRYRAARIQEVLNATEAATAEEMRALQLDHVSVAAREFVPLLLQAVEGEPGGGVSLHAQALAAVARLEAWDYEMDAEEVAPTLYWRWLSNYRQATFGDEWDAASLEDVGMPSVTVLEVLSKTEPASPWFDDVETPSPEARDDLLVRAFVQTLDDLEEEIGPVLAGWTWGEYHRIQLVHLTGLEAFSSEALPRPGGSFTVDVAHGSLTEEGLLVTGGPSWRLVVDFAPALAGGAPDAWGVYPGGQSGSPLSPHYLDLFDLWMAGEYQVLQLTTEDDFSDVDTSGGRY